MKDSHLTDKERFLYPCSRYYGHPSNQVFNANLQEFVQRAGIIASLETAGKISTSEAYSKIELLWEQLTFSMKELETDAIAARARASYF
ncbi:MAG: hypothetical protein WCA35_17785 [Kovacikia sp.]